MRFPFALSAKIAGHIIKHKLRKTPRFAMVLQLEPLHTCNLTCTGCGRIREYSTSLKDMVPLEECLTAAAECDAPMVSICGGEPLIYPKIEELVAGILKQGRIVYICTNGTAMRRIWASSWFIGGKPTPPMTAGAPAQVPFSAPRAILNSRRAAPTTRKGAKHAARRLLHRLSALGLAHALRRVPERSSCARRQGRPAAEAAE